MGTGYNPHPKVSLLDPVSHVDIYPYIGLLLVSNMVTNLKPQPSVWKCIPRPQFSTRDAHGVRQRTLPRPLPCISQTVRRYEVPLPTTA